MRRRRHIDIVEGRIVAKRTLAEADFKPSTYGYWVTDQGEIVPVPYTAHTQVAQERGMDDEYDALRAGWVRVVFRGHGVFYAQIQKVAAKAITALRSLVRFGGDSGAASFVVQARGLSDELGSVEDVQKKLSAILRAHRTVSKEFANRPRVEDEELVSEDVIPFPGNNRPVDKIAKAKGGADIYRAVRNPKFDTLDDFTRAYVEAIGFTEEIGEIRWENFDYDSAQTIIKDCQTFQAKNASFLKKAYNAGVAYHAGFAGHDFWLTRNRHGTGFWDRGLGNVGTILTDRAHAYGEVHVSIENGVVHVG